MERKISTKKEKKYKIINYQRTRNKIIYLQLVFVIGRYETISMFGVLFFKFHTQYVT